MTFRHGPEKRWLVPLLVCMLVGGVVILRNGLTSGGFRRDESVGAAGLLLAVLVIVGWIYWSEFVRVDDVGVQWKRGMRSGALKWEQIQRLECQENGAARAVGLIDRSSGQFHPLPLIPKELYGILKSKCGGLPLSFELSMFGEEVTVQMSFVKSRQTRTSDRCECGHQESQHTQGETWNPTDGRYFRPCPQCKCRDFKGAVD